MEVTFYLDNDGTLSMYCNDQEREIKKSDQSFPALLKFVSRRMWSYERFGDWIYQNESVEFEEVFAIESDNGGSSYLQHLLEKNT